MSSQASFWRVSLALLLPVIIGVPLLGWARKTFYATSPADFEGAQTAIVLLSVGFGLYLLIPVVRSIAGRIAIGVVYVIVMIGLYLYGGLWTRGYYLW